MILSGRFAAKESIQRFRTEAEAAAKLQHPTIVAIHEIGEHEGHHYFSMDYVEGKNLAQLVRDQPLAAQRAAAYVKTIAEAIHYANERGVLHRDLKPSNVLIDAFDQPHVTDFGLAKRLTDSALSTQDASQLTLTGQILGTPSYMSPEQASASHGTLGPATDIYSLGAILYDLVTGRPPFSAATPHETLSQVQTTEPVAPRLLNSTVPRDLETICLKCLDKEPRRRYGTAQELAEELGRFLRDEPILARPTNRLERAWRWCRRHPALATSSATALGLLLTVAIGSPIAALRISRERTHAQTNAAESRQRLARLHVGNGFQALANGDPSGSVPSFVEALALDQDQPDREATHRLRLGTILQEWPRLLDVFWFGQANELTPSEA
jgi:serine/threonine-protein kinase